MERAEKLTAVCELVAGSDDLAIKGKTTAYTAMNGNMFSFLSPDGVLAFRLSEQDKATFETQFGPSEVIQYNSVMRGYVEIGPDLIRNSAELARWYSKSVAYASTLKAKPTKK